MNRLQVGLSAAPRALVVAIALLAASACANERDRVLGQGVHPSGWAEPSEAAFHGSFLRSEGYPLDECRSCHGEDYAGGDVGVSCSESGACHVQGVASCAGTCHGDNTGPLPETGAHRSHASFCTTCHPTPMQLEPPHVDGTVDLELVNLAANAGFVPQWNAATQTCTNTYCHDGDSPPWSSTTPLTCDGCHVQSPIHDRFERVVDTSTCADCHGGSPGLGHLDGELIISVTACNACHGLSAATGAPPPGLDGSVDSSSPGVGAHRRHMDSLLPGRMGKVVACRRCHSVPEEVLSLGHLDSEAPADVDLVFGSYDSMTGSCVVDCHFDRDPGPVWSDDSGAERACDACHAFPPVLTRAGTRHPLTAPVQSLCLECHPFTSATHVDGEVTFQ